MENPDVIVRCEGVGKTFCRDLRRSLWYGLKDSFGQILGGRSEITELRRGEFWANQDISFELKRGECLGLIGHNGAGKTTLLKMLNGLIQPNAGSIRIRGRVGALIALGAGFNPLLTGRENVFVNSSVLGQTRAETMKVFDQIVSFAEVEDAIDAPVRTYSSGMQVRLGFAIAAQMNPELLLVDEVLAVGDNAFQKKCYDRIYEMRENGTSFIVVSHNPYQLERLCDYVAAMSDGRILKLATPKEAIHLYHTELRAKNDLADAEIAPEESREGTGEARIQRVYLKNEAGHEVREIETGLPFAIATAVEFSREVTDLRFRFTIYSDSNTLVANIGSNSQSENIVFPPGQHVVAAEFATCELLTGAYTIEAILVSARGDRIDRVPVALRFSIVTKMRKAVEQTGGVGLFYSAAEWSTDVQ